MLTADEQHEYCDRQLEDSSRQAAGICGIREARQHHGSIASVDVVARNIQRSHVSNCDCSR